MSASAFKSCVAIVWRLCRNWGHDTGMPLFLVHQHTLCDITSEMKALIDRSGMATQANGNLYKRKLGENMSWLLKKMKT